MRDCGVPVGPQYLPDGERGLVRDGCRIGVATPLRGRLSMPFSARRLITVITVV